MQVQQGESSAHVLWAELSGRVRPGGCCGSGRPLVAEPERAGRRPRVAPSGRRRRVTLPSRLQGAPRAWPWTCLRLLACQWGGG